MSFLRQHVARGQAGSYFQRTMGLDGHEREIRKLRRSADWALEKSFDSPETVAILEKLLRLVAPDSEDAFFAHRHLAELTIESNPWLAALSARRLIQRDALDEQAWALFALAMTLLSHYRAAVQAYRRALSLAPNNPWYTHNLGHLLDVGLDRPNEGVVLLARAHRKLPQETEIASSYAHALGRIGKVEEARDLLRRSIRDGGNSDQRALLAWLDHVMEERKVSVKRRKPSQQTRKRRY